MLIEGEQENKFAQSAVMYELMELYRMPARVVGGIFNCSAAKVRTYARTYTAFEDETDRIPFLSFRHHMIAAECDDPVIWIILAADNGWSTRQMEEAIKLDNAKTVEAKNAIRMSKAEKTVRFLNEVLEDGGAAAEFAYEEAKKAIRNHETKKKVVAFPPAS